MKTKRNLITVLIMLVALLLASTGIIGQIPEDPTADPEWSPEGQWISTIPTPLGNLIIESFWIALDADKTQLIGQITALNGLPLLVDLYPEGDDNHYAGGRAEKIGPNAYSVSYMQYYTKKPDPTTVEIIGMATISGTFELTGPDSLTGQGTGSYYLASQDADQDGFPDDGEEPIACFPWAWTGARPPMMPACELPPMPGQ